MLLNNLTNYNPNITKPAFGLKMTNNAVVSIIEQYKKLGSNDEEILYYLNQIRTSSPDRFELNNVEFDEQIKTANNGDKLALSTKIWLSDSKKSGEFVLPRTYDYDGETVGKFSKAETKLFYAEHLTKAINKAITKLNYGNWTPSPLQKYKNIIEKICNS